MVRALVITPDTRDAVQHVVSFAAEEANWYRPGKGVAPPGDNPRHCINLNTYRCVFSFTQATDGALYRHLSVSVPTWKDGALPNPVAFNEIAQLFGFPDIREALHTGYQLAHNVEDGCIVAMHPITQGDPSCN